MRLALATRGVGALAALGLLTGCPPREPDYPEYARHMLETSQRGAGTTYVLDCEPPNALVLVDAVAQGQCIDFAGHPRGLSLPSGPHEVTFRQSGFWDEVRYLEPNGARGVVSIKLRPHGS